jgi:hypothetical protein
MLTPRL